MAVGDNIYKPTTEPVGGYQKHPGYLARSSERGGCCPGRKKRMQYLILFFASLSFCSATLLLIVGSTSRGEVLALSVLLAMVMALVGVALVVFYLRMQGRCNLAFWPNRAARLSSTLIGEPPRSGTQMTLAEDVVPSARDDTERAKLMEESDNLDADRIGRSEPKIVLMSEVKAPSSEVVGSSEESGNKVGQLVEMS